MSKFTLSKLIGGDYKILDKLKNPKLMHFIAEHVHPSLEVNIYLIKKLYFTNLEKNAVFQKKIFNV